MSDNSIITINDAEKDWALEGTVGNWEELFMNEDNFLPILHFCRDKARNLVADVHTKEGLIARKSLAKQIGRVRKAIEDKGMEVARELKAKPKIVDATRKRVKDALDTYKDEVLKPIKDIEKRETLCEELQALPQKAIGMGSTIISQVIEELQNKAMLKPDLTFDADFWQESLDLAISSYNTAFAALDKMYDDALRSEKDAEELARLREQQAAQAEAEKAKAEAAERAKAEAEAKAAEEKLAKEEAERKAAEAEERARKAEEVAAAIKAQQEAHDREMAATAAKTKDEQKALRNAAKSAFMRLLNIDEDTAKKVVIAIHKGEIPGVKMAY